jgi:hypothetical protein
VSGQNGTPSKVAAATACSWPSEPTPATANESGREEPNNAKQQAGECVLLGGESGVLDQLLHSSFSRMVGVPLTRIADGFVDLVGTTSRDIALSSSACPAPVRQPVFRFRGLLARFVLARAVLFRYATGANNANSTIAIPDSSPALSSRPALHGWRRRLFTTNHKDIVLGSFVLVQDVSGRQGPGACYSRRALRALFRFRSRMARMDLSGSFPARLRIIRSNRRRACSGRVG